MRVLQRIINITFAFWAGFVSAISFMEAWLKFRAPGVTPEIGLGIGKLVFTALNRVEVFLFIGICILILIRSRKNAFILGTQNILFGLAGLILMVQTFWLVPALIQRAEMIIAGIEPPESQLHMLFVLLEPIKVSILIYLALKYRSK